MQNCATTTVHQVLFVDLKTASARGRSLLTVNGRKFAACGGARACNFAERQVTFVVPVTPALVAAHTQNGQFTWDGREASVVRVSAGNISTACTPVDEAGVFQGWYCFSNTARFADVEKQCAAFDGPCGMKYSSSTRQSFWCAIDSPITVPAWLPIPRAKYRSAPAAMWDDTARATACFGAYTENCTVFVPYTGGQDIAQVVSGILPGSDGRSTNMRLSSDLNAPLSAMLVQLLPAASKLAKADGGLSIGDLLDLNALIATGFEALGNASTLAVYQGFEAGLSLQYYTEAAMMPGTSSMFGGGTSVLHLAGTCEAGRADDTLFFGLGGGPECVPAQMVPIPSRSGMYALLYDGHRTSDRLYDNSTNLVPLLVGWAEYKAICAAALPDPEGTYTATRPTANARLPSPSQNVSGCAKVGSVAASFGEAATIGTGPAAASAASTPARLWEDSSCLAAYTASRKNGKQRVFNALRMAQYTGAYDFRETSVASGRFDVQVSRGSDVMRLLMPHYFSFRSSN
jgi:hypothetical protein